MSVFLVLMHACSFHKASFETGTLGHFYRIRLFNSFAIALWVFKFSSEKLLLVWRVIQAPDSFWFFVINRRNGIPTQCQQTNTKQRGISSIGEANRHHYLYAVSGLERLVSTSQSQLSLFYEKTSLGAARVSLWYEGKVTLSKKQTHGLSSDSFALRRNVHCLVKNVFNFRLSNEAKDCVHAISKVTSYTSDYARHQTWLDSTRNNAHFHARLTFGAIY